MKLEKREVTLNEADSLKDVYYLEKTLLDAYKEKDAIVRKEVANEVAQLIRQTEEEGERMYSLWKKVKAEQIA